MACDFELPTARHLETRQACGAATSGATSWKNKGGLETDPVRLRRIVAVNRPIDRKAAEEIASFSSKS
jgi:hypothetical protein